MPRGRRTCIWRDERVMGPRDDAHGDSKPGRDGQRVGGRAGRRATPAARVPWSRHGRGVSRRRRNRRVRCVVVARLRRARVEPLGPQHGRHDPSGRQRDMAPGVCAAACRAGRWRPGAGGRRWYTRRRRGLACAARRERGVCGGTAAAATGVCRPLCGGRSCGCGRGQRGRCCSGHRLPAPLCAEHCVRARRQPRRVRGIGRHRRSVGLHDAATAVRV
mmetsp:Transcript_30007/g.88999  ORF Transcript_30007/g.88999 Transcript_30007/m.88999 type:complete len:218 (+) Transcript_30007:704-1357(+)